MSEIFNNNEDRLRQKVEEMGVFFDHNGSAPMIGRVLAYLLLSEPPHKDFFEIQSFLKASKSAISNALNHLMKEGTVDYITFSGDRRRYFYVNPSKWLNQLKKNIRLVTPLSNLLKDVLQEREDTAYPKFNQQLEKMLAFNVLIAEGIERIVAEWEQQEKLTETSGK